MSDKKYKQLAPDPDTGGEFKGDGMCACPVCGSAYGIAEVPCKHFVSDWCFTADYSSGYAKGNWATAGDDVLVEFDVAVAELKRIFDYREFRSEDERERLLASLPRHLSDALDGWGDLLDMRIIDAPGYLGTHEVDTQSMASDAWSVHWAKDGAKAARRVEKLFRADLKLLRAALTKVKKAVLPEES